MNTKNLQSIANESNTEPRKFKEEGNQPYTVVHTQRTGAVQEKENPGLEKNYSNPEPVDEFHRRPSQEEK